MRTPTHSRLAVIFTVTSLATLTALEARAAEPVPAPSPAPAAEPAPAPAAEPAPAPAAEPALPTLPAPAAPPEPKPRVATVRPSRNTDTSDSSDDGPYRPPAVVPYEGGRIPRDSRIEDRSRKGIIVGGVVLVSSVYTLSLVYALSTCGAQQSCRSGSDWLYVPIVGPFITSAKSPTTGGAALAAFDGVLQLGGVAMVVAGVLFPQKMVVSPGRASLRVDPISVGSGMGVGVTMTHF